MRRRFAAAVVLLFEFHRAAQRDARRFPTGVAREGARARMPASTRASSRRDGAASTSGRDEGDGFVKFEIHASAFVTSRACAYDGPRGRRSGRQGFFDAFAVGGWLGTRCARDGFGGAGGAFESAGGRAGSGTYACVDALGEIGLPYVVKFNNLRGGTMVAIGDEGGDVRVLDATRALPRAGETGAGYEAMWEFSAHDNAIYDVAWTSDDLRLITASADRGVACYDAGTMKVVSACDDGHTSCVKAVATRPTSPDVFATGGRDGRLLVFDARQSVTCDLERVATVDYAHRLPGATSGRRRACLHSVTSVAFDNTGDVVLSSGGSDGLVKTWDLRQMKSTIGVLRDAAEDEYVRGSFYDCGVGVRFSGLGTSGSSTKPRGISGIAVDPTSSRVVVSYVDNHMAMFDANDPSGKPSRHFIGHISTSYYVKPSFSPDGARVACGSLDNNVHVWNVDRPDERSIELEGHTAGVGCVHWSGRVDGLASCADDGCVRLWRLCDAAAPPRRFHRPSRPAPAMDSAITRALGRVVDADAPDIARVTAGSSLAFAPATEATPRKRAADPSKRVDAERLTRRRPLTENIHTSSCT